MRRHFSTHSMRFRIMAVMTGIVALLVCLLLGSNLYAIGVIRGQVYSTYQTAMGIYMNGMERDLSDAETFLASIAGDSSNLQLIRQHDDRWSLAAGREQRRLSQAIPSYSAIDGFFICEPVTNTWLDSTQANYDVAQRFAVRGTLSSVLLDEAGFREISNWGTVSVGNRYVLVRIIRLHGCYVGAWADTDRLTEGFEVEGYSNIGYVFLSDAQGKPLVTSPELDSLELNPASAASHYQLAEGNDRWLMVAQSNIKGNYFLVVLVRDNSILEGLDDFTILLALVAVCVLAAIALLIYAMRHFLMRPLNNLTQAMHDLQSGDWSAHVSVKDSLDEFVEVNTTFNHMVDKIEDLKINVYEQELAKQALEMQMLKQQLTPHTFINCLNTIHGLAGTGEIRLVQVMAEDLSRHLRYVLSASQAVPLEQELEHARNYMALSALRFCEGVQLVEDIDEGALGAYVPPLLLQTFVENTIKYEVVPGETIFIHIEIKLQEKYLDICMWDTGEGYSQDILAHLSLPVQVLDNMTGKGIGIANLRQRLMLLYGKDRVCIHFSNREGAGAQIKIHLPYLAQWEVAE